MFRPFTITLIILLVVLISTAAFAQAALNPTEEFNMGIKALNEGKALIASDQYPLRIAKFQEAETHFANCVALKSDSADSWCCLAEARILQNTAEKNQQALDAIDGCVKALTSVTDLQQRNTLQGKIIDFQGKIYGSKTVDLKELLVNNTRKDVDAANWAKVLQALDEKDILTWDQSKPYTSEAYFDLAKAYQGNIDWPNAKKWYLAYQRIDPNGTFSSQCNEQLGIVVNRFFDIILKDINGIITSPIYTDEEKYNRCTVLINQAEQFADRASNDTNDLLYFKAVVEAGVGHNSDAKVLFNQYYKNAPNGRFIDKTLNYLEQFNKPHILYIQNNRLYRACADGSKPEIISSDDLGDAIDASIAPTRDLVALSTWSEKSQKYTLYIINLNTKAHSSIWSVRGHDGRIRDLSWSSVFADSPEKTRYLSFLAPHENGDYALWIWDKNMPGMPAKEVPQSKTPPDKLINLIARWSPGGEYLAFHNQNNILNVYKPVTGQPLQFKTPDVIQDVCWSSGPQADAHPMLFGFTSRGIFYINGRDLLSSTANILWLTRPGTRKAEYLPISGIEELGVSSDGDFLAARKEKTIALFRVKDGHVFPLGTYITDVSKFQFSPLGDRLAYSTADGIYVSRLDDNRDMDLRLPGTTSTADFTWSPVGNQLLWWYRDRITLCFDRVQLAGGPSLIDNATFSNPRWAVDDHAIALQMQQIDPATQQTSERIIMLTRGVLDKQIREIDLKPLDANKIADARLVDWVQ